MNNSPDGLAHNRKHARKLCKYFVQTESICTFLLGALFDDGSEKRRKRMKCFGFELDRINQSYQMVCECNNRIYFSWELVEKLPHSLAALYTSVSAERFSAVLRFAQMHCESDTFPID